jgi:hypothetical protein
MAADEARPFEIDLDPSLERAQEGEALVAELLLRPPSDLQQPSPFLLVDRLRVDVEGQQEFVGVSEDTGAAELLEELDALDWLRPTLGDVAERNDQVRLYVLDVRDRGAERDAVPVHVGEEGDSHAAEITGTP